MVQAGDRFGNSPQINRVLSRAFTKAEAAIERARDPNLYRFGFDTPVGDDGINSDFQADLEDAGMPRDLWPHAALWVSNPGDELMSTKDSKPIPTLTDMTVRFYGIPVASLPKAEPELRYFLFPEKIVFQPFGRPSFAAVALEVWMIMVMAPENRAVGSRRSPRNEPLAFGLTWPAVEGLQEEITRIKSALDALGMVKRGGGRRQKSDDEWKAEFEIVRSLAQKMIDTEDFDGELLHQAEFARRTGRSPDLLLEILRKGGGINNWIEFRRLLRNEK